MPPLDPAHIYALLSALPITMHIAIAGGAPLGRFTVGGRFPGRLPTVWRALALVQAGLLAGMACVVLDRAGLITVGLPRVLFPLAIAVTALSLLANAISPSRSERLLWTPVLAGMLLTGLAVAFNS